MPRNVHGHILGNDYIVGKAENRASQMSIIDSAISYNSCYFIYKKSNEKFSSYKVSFILKFFVLCVCKKKVGETEKEKIIHIDRALD